MRQTSRAAGPAPAGLSRRSLGRVVGGGVLGGMVAGTLAGCDLDDLTGRGPGGPLGTGDEPADDPDRLLVDAVLVDLDAQLAALAAIRTVRRLRAPLAPLTQMHRAHRAVLDPAETDAPSSAPSSAPASPTATAAPAPGPGAAVRRLREETAAYQQRLVTAALSAQSGALATLLASMSASVGQHLAVLPADPGGTA